MISPCLHIEAMLQGLALQPPCALYRGIFSGSPQNALQQVRRGWLPISLHMLPVHSLKGLDGVGRVFPRKETDGVQETVTASRHGKHGVFTMRGLRYGRDAVLIDRGLLVGTRVGRS